MTNNRHAKCQSKNPTQCTDPQCPERRGYRAQMASATNFNEYAAGATRQRQDQDAQRRRQFEQQARSGNIPSQFKGRNNRRPETTRDGDPIIKFHKDIGFPPSYRPPSGVREVTYSRHAQTEAEADRYGAIPKMTHVNLDQMELIELKVNAKTKQVYRFLYRGKLDEDRDVCVVLQPLGNNKMMVVTNWINERNDAHRSLRREEYAIPKAKAA